MHQVIPRVSVGWAACLAVCLASAGAVGAAERSAAPVVQLQAAAPFSDHMVLQREMEVPIFGTAAPGEKVTAKFRGQEVSANAGVDGKWRIRLTPIKVQPGPQKGADLVIMGKDKTLTFEDVLVGEVWLGSGQSNMQIGLNNPQQNKEVRPTDQIRVLVSAPGAKTKSPLVGEGGVSPWAVADNPTDLRGFSELLFFFGQRLHQDLNVPVGLMVGAVGGTPSGDWCPREAVVRDPEILRQVELYAKVFPEFEKRNAETTAAWEKLTPEQRNARPWGDPMRPNMKGVPKPLKPEHLQRTGRFFESHICPLVGYAIRGVLWDQGESAVDIPGVDQYTMMGVLVRAWRDAWGQGEFPWLYMQKHSGGGPALDYKDPVTCMAEKFEALPPDVPAAPRLGLHQEFHIMIMRHPNTAMVSVTDLGEGVHPKNKFGYGSRAARVAEGFVYKMPVEIYGPIYESHKVEGNKVVIKFAHAGRGLTMAQSERLQGFQIAGKDRTFVWADAAITGKNTVDVRSDKVLAPVAVRYAWARLHPWANLFNKDGLPALTFRTDTWKTEFWYPKREWDLYKKKMIHVFPWVYWVDRPESP